MSHFPGSVLFVVAVVGNLIAISAGLVFAVGVLLRRGMQASTARSLAAARHDVAFHHPDKIQTSLSEWLFMAAAAVIVLLGLPLVLGLIFQYLVPMLGRAWTR
jgi:hypothetical protein